jgi:hypothetical protein
MEEMVGKAPGWGVSTRPPGRPNARRGQLRDEDDNDGFCRVRPFWGLEDVRKPGQTEGRQFKWKVII